MVFWILAAAAVVFVIYVRLSPSIPERWHVPPKVEADRDMRGGAMRVVETGPDGLARLDKIAMQTPRTLMLAGSVEDGMVTYVTRTAVIGFPDYTTVQQVGDTMKIHARLRFGRSDFGVNRRRVDQWLAALQPG